MSVIESEQYRLPTVDKTLKWGTNFEDAAKPNDFRNLPALIELLGYSRRSRLGIDGDGLWEIYHRPKFEIENFPEGATTTYSSIGLHSVIRERSHSLTESVIYDDPQLTHAVLRISPNPYDLEEFQNDLRALTRGFIERPRFWGFPSRELYNPLGFLVSGGIGALWGSTVDTQTIQSAPDSMMNFGTICGVVGGPLIHFAVGFAAEQWAKMQVSHHDQYIVGKNAEEVIKNEREHRISVYVKKQLFTLLCKKGAELTAEQFLEYIYTKLDQDLIAQRCEEVEADVFPNGAISSLQRSALPTLMSESFAKLDKDGKVKTPS